MVTNYSNLHHFDSIKWKKRLVNLSHKLARSHRHHEYHWNADHNNTSQTAATVMAAATEKFIRHHDTKITPTNINEIVIHSEDLTASQFANLTGIKTKRNSSCSLYGDLYSDEDDEDDEDIEPRDYYSTTITHSVSCSGSSSMRIWDSHFWQEDCKNTPVAVPGPTPVAPVHTSTTSIIHNENDDIMKNQQQTTPLQSCLLARNRSEPVPSMIQKGRFKIVWGQDAEENIKPVMKKKTECVEWKRKRASSNST